MNEDIPSVSEVKAAIAARDAADIEARARDAAHAAEAARELAAEIDRETSVIMQRGIEALKAAKSLPVKIDLLVSVKGYEMPALRPAVAAARKQFQSAGWSVALTAADGRRQVALDDQGEIGRVSETIRFTVMEIGD